MRSLLLALIAAVAVPSCTQDITGGGPKGGDDQGGAVCGNGVVEGSETCDDSNTVSGDGCSSACQTETAGTPRVSGSSDKQSVSTELGKTETINLTITGEEGFAGTVNIAPTLVDTATSAAIPGVTVASASPSVVLDANGTQMVAVTITIPTNATAKPITGSLKIALTSSAAEEDVTVPVALANIYTIDYSNGTGTAPTAHMNAGMEIHVLKGTLLHFKNDDTTTTHHSIHADNPFHQPDPDNVATQVVGDTYEINTSASGNNAIQAGCHVHGTTSYAIYDLD